MKCCKKLLMSVACAALMLGSVSAQAADDDEENEFSSKIASGENVVLFKIHDIKPLRDDVGDIKECEFGLTLYNRSPKTIDAITMDLSWLDESVAEVIDAEYKDEQEALNKQKLQHSVAKNLKNVQNQPQPKTEDFTPKMLNTSIDLPKIKPFRQVTLKSKLKSDRCFLMMKEVDVSFSSCNITDEKPDNVDRRAALNRSQTPNECKSLFRFVSPRDPEYYREFQKVSFNEDAARRQQVRKNDMEEMEKNYNKIIQSVNHVTEVLETIR